MEYLSPPKAFRSMKSPVISTGSPRPTSSSPVKVYCQGSKVSRCLQFDDLSTPRDNPSVPLTTGAPPEQATTDKPLDKGVQSSTSSDCKFLERRTVKKRLRESSLCIVFSDKQDQWSFTVDVSEQEESERESVLSIQSKETAVVQDSEDDLWFLSEDDKSFSEMAIEVDSNGVSFEIGWGRGEDAFDEYEIASYNSSTDGESIQSRQSSMSIYAVCNDTDEVFWGDHESCQSDSEDSEIQDGDYWTCEGCLNKNTPIQRFCERCWNLRSNWVTTKASKAGIQECIIKTDIPACSTVDSRQWSAVITDELANKNQLRRSCSADTLPISDISSVSELDISTFSSIHAADSGIGSFSQNTRSPICNLYLASTPVASKKRRKKRKMKRRNLKEDECGVAVKDPCSVCLLKPKDASLVHGKSGHQVCCYSCAKKLKQKGKPCPVCRKAIQKVIRNYLV